MAVTGAAQTNLDLISKSKNPGISNTDQLDKDESKSNASRKSLASNFNDFMLMLTTQLKNQDPTEPLDTNQFTQQLVMFAGVEQQINANSNLEKLVSMSESQGVDSAVGYIGRMVEAKGNGGFLNDGVAPFIYSLDRPAEKVSVVITDATGRAVFSGNGSTNAGKNLVTWDGTNSFTGQKMQEGTYYLMVQATDYSGKQIEPVTYTSGRVSAVEMGEGGSLLLTVGNLQVPASDILAVREEPQEASDDNGI